MSFFKSRRDSVEAPPQPVGILSAGRPTGKGLAEILTLVRNGTTTYDKAVAALAGSRAPLVLNDATVDGTGARVLFLYLRGGCAAKSLAFDNVAFAGDDAFLKLCNGLCENRSIEKVALTSCGLTDAQAHKLALALTPAGLVTSVDLSRNALVSPTDCIGRLTQLTKLERLCLSGNRLTCAHTLAGAVAAHWPCLEELVLLDTGFDDEDAEEVRSGAARGNEHYRDYSTVARRVSLS